MRYDVMNVEGAVPSASLTTVWSASSMNGRNAVKGEEVGFVLVRHSRYKECLRRTSVRYCFWCCAVLCCDVIVYDQMKCVLKLEYVGKRASRLTDEKNALVSMKARIFWRARKQAY